MSHWTHLWHVHCSHSDKALSRSGTTQHNIHTPMHTWSAWCYHSGRDSGNIRPPPPEQTELYPFPFFATFGKQTCVFHIPANLAGLTGKETQLLCFKVWTKLLDPGSNKNCTATGQHPGYMNAVKMVFWVTTHLHFLTLDTNLLVVETWAM